jgi:ABC-type lipoprotein release transport system permease subunit
LEQGATRIFFGDKAMKNGKVIRSIAGASVMFVMFIMLAPGAEAEGIAFQNMGRALNILPEVSIYTAKKSITMDSRQPEAEAVAVPGRSHSIRIYPWPRPNPYFSRIAR